MREIFYLFLQCLLLLKKKGKRSIFLDHQNPPNQDHESLHPFQRLRKLSHHLITSSSHKNTTIHIAKSTALFPLCYAPSI